MTSNEVYIKIESAYGKLTRNDAHLFELDVNERSITHKLAEYLQQEFPEWNVDCEYNRDGDVPKRVFELINSAKPDDANATTVYPDIIIHKRGRGGPNVVVIEAKKVCRSGVDNDEEKLKAYRNELNYDFAFKIVLGSKTHAIQEVFV